jgi:hypothetical protein
VYASRRDVGLAAALSAIAAVALLLEEQMGRFGRFRAREPVARRSSAMAFFLEDQTGRFGRFGARERGDPLPAERGNAGR